MFDNITVNAKTGQSCCWRTSGDAAHNGKMWLYDPATDDLVKVAKHDPARFGDVGHRGDAAVHQDEETSGVIDVSSHPRCGVYLTSDQAHYAINATTPRGFSNPERAGRGRSAAARAHSVPGRGRTRTSARAAAGRRSSATTARISRTRATASATRTPASSPVRIRTINDPYAARRAGRCSCPATAPAVRQMAETAAWETSVSARSIAGPRIRASTSSTDSSAGDRPVASAHLRRLNQIDPPRCPTTTSPST